MSRFILQASGGSADAAAHTILDIYRSICTDLPGQARLTLSDRTAEWSYRHDVRVEGYRGMHSLRQDKISG